MVVGLALLERLGIRRLSHETTLGSARQNLKLTHYQRRPGTARRSFRSERRSLLVPERNNGSTRTARRAGIQQARAAIATITAMAAPNVSGSFDDVFHTWFTRSRFVARLVATPMIRPTLLQPQSQDHPNHVSPLAPERHANRNLARLLRYRVREYAIYAKGHEHDAGAREYPEYEQAETRPCEEHALDQVIHRDGLDQCGFPVGPLNLLPDGVDDEHRLVRGAHDEPEPGRTT